MKRMCISIAVVCALLTPIWGQNLEWHRVYPEFVSGTGACQVNDVIMDDYCNVYVTGVSNRYCWEDDSLTTIKYDKYGNIVWVSKYSAFGYHSEGSTICRDNEGNTYVAGYAVDGNGNAHLLVVKHNSSGQIVWTKTLLQNPRFVDWYTIAYDNWYGEKSVYVATMKGDDAWLVQLNADVGTLEWYDIYDYNNEWNWWADLIVKSDANHVYFYVTGGTDYPMGYFYIVTAKFVDWCLYPENMDIYGYNSRCGSFDMDDQGNIYVTGCSHKSTEYQHPIILKYNNDIDLLWDFDYDAEGYSSSCRDIAVYGPTGDAYATGFIWRGSHYPWYKNILTIGVDTQGNLVWAEEAGDELTTEEGFELSVTSNCVYVCGLMENAFGFGEMWTMCHNRQTGSGYWYEHYSQNYEGRATDIAVQPDKLSRNKVYIADGGWCKCEGQTRMSTLLYSYYEPNLSPDFGDNNGPQGGEVLYTGPFRFEAVYPNPAHGMVHVRFMSPDERHVTVKLYDATGRVAEKLYDGLAHNGLNEIQYNGKHLANGVYFLRAQAGEELITEKVIFQR
jgi:hypothetical protein